MRAPVAAVAVVAFGLVLVAPSSASALTPNDSACRVGLNLADGVNSAEVLAYQACRFDKLDASVKALGATTPTPSASPTPTATPSASPTPTVTPTTPSPSPTVAPTSASPSPTATAGALNLPVVPQAVGNGYWSQYAKAKAAGWADPSFFPIALWYGSAGTDAQVKFDKAHGINTYAQNNPGNPYSLLKSNNMFSLYSANGAPADDSQQVGFLLDDEVDGRYSDADGIAHLKALDAQYTPAGSGLFSYVNYTSGIVTFDRSVANSSAYLNGSFNDVIGVDQYFYSNPHCDTLSLRWRTPANGTTIDRNNCRTASSYGKMIDLQREVDVSDGKIDKPIWAFVEVISPGGTANGYKQPTGDQIKGAAWNSLIHGAAGIDWFSQSPDGGSANTCSSGDALRDAQQGVGCAAIKTNVEAMGQVNAQIKSLAPVLNSPTLKWDLATAADTLLKVKDGSAYVFAMTKDGGTGARTFTLPAGVGSSVEVVGEGRTIIASGGKFTDSFAKESDVHIYKVVI